MKMEEYKFKEKIGSDTIYHNGLILSKFKEERLNDVITRCWESLSREKQREIYEELEKEDNQH
jgi:hypothetical protein